MSRIRCKSGIRIRLTLIICADKKVIRRTGTVLFLVLHVAMWAVAQQNLFNVPSSDITIKGKPFFQQQINVPRNGHLLLTSTFSYGLGFNAEVGLNVIGLEIASQNGALGVVSNADPSRPPLYPFFTINAQKAFVLSPMFKVSIGTQAGFAPGMQNGSFSYLNMVTAIPQIHAKVVTGLNHGTDSFLGPGDRNPVFSTTYDPVGYQLGLEQELIREILLLQVEHISGSHNLGVSVLGLGVHLSEHWVISAGYQFSSHGNPTPNSLVFEFTYVPSVMSHRRIYHEGHPEID